MGRSLQWEAWRSKSEGLRTATLPKESHVSVDRHQASSYLERLLRERSQDELVSQLSPCFAPLPPDVPGGSHVTDEALDRRWELVAPSLAARAEMLDSRTLE